MRPGRGEALGAGAPAGAAGLLDPDRALALVLERAPGPRPARRLLPNALGARLLAPVIARVAQPPFTKALMDGFAVRLADAGLPVRCAGEVQAGGVQGPQVTPGVAVEIMTGAPCPPGTEAVVMVEDVVRQGERITLPPTIQPGQHLQPMGCLCLPGDEILPAGSLVTSVALAAATAVGATEVTVGAAPAVAIVTTGDELAAPGVPLGDARIYDSNGPMLQALALAAGADHALVLHAVDTETALTEALAEAAHEDIVVLSGGVSMGRYDLVPEVLVSLGFEKIFHKVAQKPGKPLFFAMRGEQLVFGLPGTPLGSHLGFHRYVAAAIRKRLGLPLERRLHRGRLVEELRTGGDRTLFRLAHVERRPLGWIIDPLAWSGSSDLVGPARANAYLRFPPGEQHYAAGQELGFELVDGAQDATYEATQEATQEATRE